MRHGSLFNGIGGFQLAAKWMNWKNVFSCEVNDFCNQVTKFYYPECKQEKDVRTTDFKIYRGTDILSGGFPCQPFSTSGKQLGEQDEQYLYEEMLRAVSEIEPRWIVAENVFGITQPKFRRTFEFICSSLEDKGYKVQPYIIPATAVKAEHERYRVWFVAYAERFGSPRQGALLGPVQPEKIADRETSGFINFIQGNTMPFLCNSHYGFSRGLSEQALHAAGNAIVPQVAFEIFKAIEQYETL